MNTVPTVTLYTGEVVPLYWKALRTVYYVCGQCIDDRIRRGEILEVDPNEYRSYDMGNKEPQLAFANHASRYGPFLRECFVPLTMRQIENWNKKRKE